MEWQKITFNGMEAFVAKIDSNHLKMTFNLNSSSAAVYHVAQLKDPKNNIFYESLISWLRGESNIEGKEF